MNEIQQSQGLNVIPSVDEMDNTQAFIQNNNTRCQEWIKNNCSIGDPVLVYPKCDKNSAPFLGAILEIGVQSVVIALSDGEPVSAMWVRDHRTLSSEMAGRSNSFDHTDGHKKMLQVIRSAENLERATTLAAESSQKVLELEESILRLQRDVIALKDGEKSQMQALKALNTKIDELSQPLADTKKTGK